MHFYHCPSFSVIYVGFTLPALFYCHLCSSCTISVNRSLLVFLVSLRFPSCLSKTSCLIFSLSPQSIFFISIIPPSAFLSCVSHYQSCFHLSPFLPNTHYYLCVCVRFHPVRERSAAGISLGIAASSFSTTSRMLHINNNARSCTLNATSVHINN